ncbi:hypothetical protein [Streptomyces sp. NPDC093568]|uniref:hypothetical protein n=1 Tax=Streptomyces sp. NPDC093568 TaxID=3366041 RepID=UPI003815DFD6
MRNGPIVPDPEVGDEELDRRKGAKRALVDALHAAEIRSVCDVGRTLHSPAVTLVLLSNGDDSTFFPDGMAVPDRSAASVLKHALHSISVEADIVAEAVGPEPALRVQLPTCDDASGLAQWIMDHLPAPHQAAHQLRTALTERGIEARGVHGTREAVTVGCLAVQDAALLSRILHKVRGVDPEPEDDWRAVEYLAARTGAILSAATGDVVMVLADPACSSCSRSRPHRLDVGDLTVPAAHRLIEAMGARGGPGSPRPG